MSPSQMPIEIRELTTNSELEMVQQLEKEVWNMHPIPLHQTLTAAQNGGLVLGAFTRDQLVSFSYSFAGFKAGKSYLCSHMLGTHPDYQGKGIGAQLKEAQRQKALEMGYSLITWTYDPLESRNAFLNLSKLHAICSTYVENCYGDMIDDLNHGLPTDRFKIEWWIKSAHVQEKEIIDVTEQTSPFQIVYTEKGFPKLKDVRGTLEMLADQNNNDQILVPVPCNFQQIKKEDFELAIHWRLKTRKIFMQLFSNGYAVCALKKDLATTVHHYVLVKKDTLNL